MSDKDRELLITVGLSVGDLVLQIIAMISQKGIFLIVGGLATIVLGIVVIRLYIQYKHLRDTYEFIKFLFFGSKDNGFNFFPKLKMYMDYLGDNNQLEVETMEFEYTTDVINNHSDVTWTMKNVYNTTKSPINTYYLYSSNESGMINVSQMEIKGTNKELCIDASRVESRNGIQKTPYTFDEPIKPKERISEIKIHMDMQTIFDTSKHDIVYLYPRNYGTKVKHMKIKFSIKGIKKVIVKLHEVGKRNGEYRDDEIKSGRMELYNGIGTCILDLDGDEINIDNMYYLLIKAEVQK